MRRYTCDPNLKLIGQTVLSLFSNVRVEDIDPILEKHEIRLNDVRPDGWYPLARVMDAFSDLQEHASGMFNFVAVGIRAAELSPLTPGIEAMSFEQFLLMYPQVYQTRHRDGDPGGLIAEKVAEGHIKLTLDIPYPDDVFYGLFYGFARRLLPEDTEFTVYYDEETPRKDQGGSVTIIHVTWG